MHLHILLRVVLKGFTPATAENVTTEAVLGDVKLQIQIHSCGAGDCLSNYLISFVIRLIAQCNIFTHHYYGEGSSSLSE